MTPELHTTCAARHLDIASVTVCSVTERDVVELAERAWADGSGGWVVTANTDILRLANQDEEIRRLIGRATLVVADGMPLVWASRIAGDGLPQRVTGSSLIFSLCRAAAVQRRRVFFLGGAPDVPHRAAERLQKLYPGFAVAGVDSPPMGFENNVELVALLVQKVATARPDLVMVGLGFPKQENLIERLIQAHPSAFYVGCGAAIPIAAEMVSRAPATVQRIGLEWLYRLLQEPQRLAGRYLYDAFFACSLLLTTLRSRLRSARDPSAGGRLQ
jgi:N-acetylglucosaminyldiphosphoundecaprenol N-acetyl-beta-D-mannosaminyltransferase